jgi:tetratricopeptide (TPR) repeat protein
VASEITRHHTRKQAIFNWLVLVVLVFAFVHGMVDNYLYNAKGSLLALVLVAFAANTFGGSQRAEPKIPHPSRVSGSLASRLQDNRLTLPVFGLFLIFVTLFFFRLNDIRSVWYANQGALEMAKVELAGFPTNAWAGPQMAAQLGSAEASLQQALQLNPYNQTANYRLGAIAMLRRDFDSARAYLEIAYQSAPHHRGIIKMLGYSYVWLNELDRAGTLLAHIPESKDELDVYSWWWGEQDRSDLSAQAKTMISKLSESDLNK